MATPARMRHGGNDRLSKVKLVCCGCVSHVRSFGSTDGIIILYAQVDVELIYLLFIISSYNLLLLTNFSFPVAYHTILILKAI